MTPAWYAAVPPSGVLGAPAVRCARCRAWLRPGDERAVEVDAAGAWQCERCPRFARKPRRQSHSDTAGTPEPSA